MGRAGHRTALTTSALATTAIAACAALLLAGCTSAQGPGGDESAPAPIASGPGASQEPSESAGAGDGASEPAEPEPEPAASATETASGPAFAANTEPDTAEPSGAGNTFLSVTDVRVATHDGYDRVVFDLDGTGSGKPGWRVEYVDQAVDDGSGDTVRVAGDAILRVSISGTATPMDSGVDEFSGDRIEPADTEAIDEIVYRYWFEGYTTAFLGVDGAERPFRAFLLEDPMRVVVDVQH
ncbi:AMIN-like domain-containing (lipo)protein [Promicromonospora sukumoe]|uniref:AMIN-like domain-containing (lipo)protein n=1 Tax=Promicromonospora sukumoe TaxID=88382 RepID=UPI0003707850|nr:hypothetical protein [Promicromonospora sukumoe]